MRLSGWWSHSSAWGMRKREAGLETTGASFDVSGLLQAGLDSTVLAFLPPGSERTSFGAVSNCGQCSCWGGGHVETHIHREHPNVMPAWSSVITKVLKGLWYGSSRDGWHRSPRNALLGPPTQWLRQRLLSFPSLYPETFRHIYIRHIYIRHI